jgi:hypothetical protein
MSVAIVVRIATPEPDGMVVVAVSVSIRGHVTPVHNVVDSYRRLLVAVRMQVSAVLPVAALLPEVAVVGGQPSQFHGCGNAAIIQQIEILNAAAWYRQTTTVVFGKALKVHFTVGDSLVIPVLALTTFLVQANLSVNAEI